MKFPFSRKKSSTSFQLLEIEQNLLSDGLSSGHPDLSMSSASSGDSEIGTAKPKYQLEIKAQDLSKPVELKERDLSKMCQIIVTNEVPTVPSPQFKPTTLDPVWKRRLSDLDKKTTNSAKSAKSRPPATTVKVQERSEIPKSAESSSTRRERSMPYGGSSNGNLVSCLKKNRSANSYESAHRDRLKRGSRSVSAHTRSINVSEDSSFMSVDDSQSILSETGSMETRSLASYSTASTAREESFLTGIPTALFGCACIDECATLGDK